MWRLRTQIEARCDKCEAEKFFSVLGNKADCKAFAKTKGWVIRGEGLMNTAKCPDCRTKFRGGFRGK